MKITKETAPFLPVTITLENQEEVDKLYNMSVRAQTTRHTGWTRDFQLKLAALGARDSGAY